MKKGKSNNIPCDCPHCNKKVFVHLEYEIDVLNDYTESNEIVFEGNKLIISKEKKEKEE